MINIVNLHKKKKIDKKEVEKIAEKAIRRFRKKPEALEINLVFVTDAFIKKLNRTYRHKNAPTDVLCFPISKKQADIYISLDAAKYNSKRFKTDFNAEVYLYVIHGILHMLGYRDNAKCEKSKMEKLQFSLLERL